MLEQDQRKVTIITTYRVYNQIIESVEPQTATAQQWEVARQSQNAVISITEKTAIDLKKFITTITNKDHDIILGINANEVNVFSKNMISKLCHSCILIDLLELKDDTSQEPNTCCRGSRCQSDLGVEYHVHKVYTLNSCSRFEMKIYQIQIRRDIE